MTAGRPHDTIRFASSFIPHWREFLETYPRSATSLVTAIAVIILADFSLILKQIEFSREQTALRFSMTQAEIRYTAAMEATEHNVSATGAGLARRQSLLTRELHLAVDCDRGTMYLRRDGAVLREMSVRLVPEATASTRPDAVAPGPPRGRRTVERVVDDSFRWEVPVTHLGKPVPSNLGPLAIILDNDAVIYADPKGGPPVDASQFPPGSVDADIADLEAIKANLQPGMKVYFY